MDSAVHDGFISPQNDLDLRRSYSTRSTASPLDRQKRRELQRKRPSTLHIKRPTTIPTVSIEEPLPLPSGARQREKRESISGRGSREREKNLDGETLQIRIECPPTGHSRSASPRPRSNTRRDSMMSMLNRIWRSDESTRKPTMTKMAALDVPSAGEPLTRQLSLSDTNVTPREPQSRTMVLLALSPRQKKLLKSSFAQLNSGGTFLRIVEQVFRRLEVKCPDIRSIFLTTAFVNSLSRERSSPPLVKTEHDHCKCLVDIFDKIINCLDEVDSQLPLLRLFGEKHALMRESGFTGAMIEHFGEIFVAVIGSQDAVKYNQDTTKAWRLLLAYVTDEMKVGFDRFSKRSERRGSGHNECPHARTKQ